MRRAAYLSGSWYPADPGECQRAIEEFSADVTPLAGNRIGLIGPHAGFAYSGRAAGRAYQWLAADTPSPEVCVVFGSHRGPSGPNTLFRGDAWETPLGALNNAKTMVAETDKRLVLAAEPTAPTRPDNGVELHLPFIKHFFPRAKLLMLGVAASQEALNIGRAVGESIRNSGESAVFIGSTDLTHYGPNYGFSPLGDGPDAVTWVREHNDQDFIGHVLRDEPGAAIDHARENASACCPGAAGAALEAARAFGHQPAPKLVDHYLSCDVHPNDSFVGYAGIVF